MQNIDFKKIEFNKITDKLALLCYSEGGRSLALELIPDTNIARLNKGFQENEEAMELLRFIDTGFLYQLQAIDAHIAKARVKALLSPHELIDLYRFFKSARLARKALIKKEFSELSTIAEALYENPAVEKQIEQAINDEGEIKDTASPALKDIRNNIKHGRIRIREYLQSFIRSTNNQKYLQEALITERDGRYVVPIKQEHKNDVVGIIHDESASGATVFIEPMPVVELSNRIRLLHAEEKREIEKIIRELSMMISLYVNELKENYEILANIDLIFARARLAYQMNAYRPELNNQGIIEINKARHPLLGDNAIPINIELGKRFDILVITGPNTGGKTVVLKTIGLLSLMAMCSLFIPAQEKSKIAVFEKIFIDIGDEQSIEQSLSTFSSHMKNIINILKNADDKTLVLLDELGAGTDPMEGAALGRAILEDIKSKKAKSLVTTHQSELKNYAYQVERVENACVEFNPETFLPTYSLSIGMPGQSNAFEISKRLGLDEKLVTRAKELLPEREIELGEMLKGLKASQYKIDINNKEVELTKNELLKEKEKLEQSIKQFQIEKEKQLAQTQKEATLYLKQIKEEADLAILEIKEILKNQDKAPKWHEIEQSRQRLKNIRIKNPREDYQEHNKEVIKLGDFVEIKELKQKGYVLEISTKQKEATVQVGIMKINVKLNQVIKSDSPDEIKTHTRNRTYLEKARNISPDLDLRGKLVEDALIELEKYLEDAHLVNLKKVCIIHGKGTGALRRAVREHLQSHYYITTYRDGLLNEGGHGVTIAELR